MQRCRVPQVHGLLCGSTSVEPTLRTFLSLALDMTVTSSLIASWNAAESVAWQFRSSVMHSGWRSWLTNSSRT